MADVKFQNVPGNKDAKSVAEATDVASLVMGYNPNKAKTIERDSHQAIRCCCPFPTHDDHSPSFFIYTSGPKKGRFVCTPSCGHGDIFEFVKRMENLDFKQALAFLKSKMPGGILETNWNAQKYIAEIQQMMKPAAKDDHVMPEMPHCERNYKMIAWYMNWKRKYEFADALKVIEEWGLLWCNDPSYYFQTADNPRGMCFENSIIEPLADENGKTVMWQAQFVDGRTGKNKLYPVGSWTPFVIPGLNRCIKQGYRWALLVEGFWNLAKAWHYGVPAIATMSAWVSEEQLQSIFKHLDRVVTGYDNDDAGREAAYRIEKNLGSLIEVKHLPVQHKVQLGRKLDIDEMQKYELGWYLERVVDHVEADLGYEPKQK